MARPAAATTGTTGSVSCSTGAAVALGWPTLKLNAPDTTCESTDVTRQDTT
ncbi:hypothetical protein [Microbispora bryophytorum]|uniref:hypothetical protein n=1 Tax=Microbispora bryophytorum TaxID=1460882 RepID=UPI0036110235